MGVFDSGFGREQMTQRSRLASQGWGSEDFA